MKFYTIVKQYKKLIPPQIVFCNAGLSNSVKYCNVTAITPFKVTHFGTNRKLIYDFLLVINYNLPPILHRFQVMANYLSNFR